MVCLKCNGLGTYKAFGECNHCKGTGEAVVMYKSVCEVQGVKYSSGDILPFTNTASKVAQGKIVEFFVSTSFMSVQHQYPVDTYPLKCIWYKLVNTATGTESVYPLWKSITIDKKTQLFATNAVVEKGDKR